MKKKLMILFMMILLVLSFGTRNAAAEDEDETRAISQVELTYIIFGYEEGQEAWIPGVEQCPVPEPYSTYGDGYWAGKKTYNITDGSDLEVELSMDPAYGVGYPGMPYEYYSFDRMKGILYYKPSAENTTIYLSFFKFPLLDFGEDHADLLNAFASEGQVYDGHYLKMDSIGGLVSGSIYGGAMSGVMDKLEEINGNKHLIDNDKRFVFVSRNSADADISALKNELYRYSDTVAQYNYVQEGETYYCVWYAYETTSGDGQTWNKESSEGPSFTFKRDLADEGVDYASLGELFLQLFSE